MIKHSLIFNRLNLFIFFCGMRKFPQVFFKVNVNLCKINVKSNFLKSRVT
jgi:hypothetical protein